MTHFTVEPLPPRPSLEHQQKLAKRLLRDCWAGDADAIARVRAFLPGSQRLCVCAAGRKSRNQQMSTNCQGTESNTRRGTVMDARPLLRRTLRVKSGPETRRSELRYGPSTRGSDVRSIMGPCSSIARA